MQPTSPAYGLERPARLVHGLRRSTRSDASGHKLTHHGRLRRDRSELPSVALPYFALPWFATAAIFAAIASASPRRSEKHTSELQSLMRRSYAVFCLKKKHKD